jgi:hypothetical protein
MASLTHATSKRRARGEDSIYWDAIKSCYVGAVGLGYSPSGKRIRKRVMARTKTEVREKLKELHKQAQNVGVSGPLNPRETGSLSVAAAAS